MNPRTIRIDPALIERLPLSSNPAHVRQRIEAMEKLLEGLFVVPGINRRVGLDALLGLIPVVGDLIAAVLGAWIVWEARNLGMSRFQLARMSARVGFDALLGMVPIVGDAADFFYRSNTLNVKQIKRHLDKHHPSTVTIEV